MILSRKYKYVFISTPKTGSHSFFKLLQENFDGERQWPGFHRTEMPPKTNGYTVFSTCRNPYDRLVALWNSLLFAKPDKHGYRDTWLSVLKTDDFRAFAQFASRHANDIENIARVRMPTLLIPQHRWYKRMPENVIPVHIENVSEEFNALPFVDKPADIPHALKRDHATWAEVKSDAVVHYANIWAGEDFEKFGYKRED